MKGAFLERTGGGENCAIRDAVSLNDVLYGFEKQVAAIETDAVDRGDFSTAESFGCEARQHNQQQREHDLHDLILGASVRQRGGAGRPEGQKVAPWAVAVSDGARTSGSRIAWSNRAACRRAGAKRRSERIRADERRV